MMKAKQQNKTNARQGVRVSFTPHGWDDYLHWREADTKVLDAINTLVNECLRTPFKGTGKPEPLKGDLSGFWSRRITKEHRLVYLYENGVLTILQCRFHYA
ncbi:MAG: Txe/YoeB family addiction module toxin [Pseudomonas sp.]|nr:Txe/YoeB family addiction module toxin [Pseudomonas sp. PIA16]MDE1167251.1 Txe/YoeB family addiction module toxin [Pseudomonas sp.]